jgi:hypothetical protein
MTLDEFRSKYRLQQRLTQRGVASYQAIDSSGRVVMVHSLDSASHEEVDHVRGMIHRLSAVDRKRILEILDVDGAPVLVTEFLQGFQGLAQWLEVRTRADPTAPVAPIVHPKGPRRGEFTQLFGPAEVPKTPVVERPPAAGPPAAPALPILPQAAPKAPAAAGEFTRLFGAIGPEAAPPPDSAREPPKPPPREAPPPVPNPPPPAGEFTGLFGAIKDQPGAAGPGEAAPPSGPPTPPAGDFTQLFGPGAGKPAPTPSEPPPAPKPTPVSPPPPGAEHPKIVVRWRDSPPPEPPPPAAAKPQIRWKQSGTEDAGRPEPPPPQKGPGEFTRLFGPQDSLQAPPDRAAANIEPLLPEPPSPQPPSARPPAHAPRAGAKDAGGFTQLLRAAADSLGDPTNPPEVGGAPAVPGSPAKAPGEFTSLMAGLPPAAAVPGGVPQPPAQPAAFGPSEFTRMISGVPMPPAPAAGGGRPQAAPPPEPAAEEGEEGPSLVKLFVALGVVLVLAAALIIFFAIK